MWACCLSTSERNSATVASNSRIICWQVAKSLGSLGVAGVGVVASVLMSDETPAAAKSCAKNQDFDGLLTGVTGLCQ